MRLENFEISNEIELQTGDLFWDIHNFAIFEGLELIPATDTVVMKWTAPKRDNPWGCLENRSSGMHLRFDKLQFLNLSPRDPQMPFSEDACVSEVLKVDPKVEHNNPAMRTREPWALGDSFRLVFQFQSGRVIEIESETVELIPIN